MMLSKIRIVPALHNEDPILERDNYFGPGSSWPHLADISFINAPISQITNKHMVIGRVRSEYTGGAYLDPKIWHTSKIDPKRIKEITEQRQFIPLPTRSEDRGWKSIQTVSLSSAENPEKNGFEAVVQKKTIYMHQKFKGGDNVTFKALMNCPDGLDLEPSGGSSYSDFYWSKYYPAAKLSMTVREIYDGSVTTSDGKNYRTKTAFGYIDSTLAGRNPNCPIGQLVYADDGSLYGVITKYYPEGGKEAYNIEIATVQDDRLGFLFHHWYQMPSIQKEGTDKCLGIYTSPPLSTFQSTPANEQFDPGYLKSLEEKLVAAAIDYALMEKYKPSCNPVRTEKELCDYQQKRLSSAFKRRFNANPKPPRSLPTVLSCAKLSSAKTAVTAGSCKRF